MAIYNQKVNNYFTKPTTFQLIDKMDQPSANIA